MNVEAAQLGGLTAKAVDDTLVGDPGEITPLSFADGLLRVGSLGEAGAWTEEGRRMGVGVGLSALFGAALGLRTGGAGILFHALGVPAGLLAAAGIAVPAFAIVLALADAPIDARTLAAATTRGVAKAGLVLGGLAPAAALYVVTVEDALTVSIVGFGGLLLAGLIASASFASDLAPSIASAKRGTRAAMWMAMPAFRMFAAVLALRVWWLTLPLLGGGR
jgi:hypothetical protein